MLNPSAGGSQTLVESAAPDTDPRNFSIVLGGPLFQLLRRAHMSGDALELLRRRIVTISATLWLPLVVLAFADRVAAGGGVDVPFLKDIQVHARFLVAVPLLVLAELVVHARLRPIANEFLVRDLVPPESTSRFQECLASTLRLRNSIVAELVMLVVVYSVGVHLIWSMIGVIDAATWYATPSEHGAVLTRAGYWYAYVSVPLFQFLFLRWYYRMALWIRFLWKVSRIRLNLSAMHADRMAGLGFLAGTVYAFVPLLLAHGALLSGTIADRVLFTGARLADSAVEIAVVVAFLLVLVLVPLTVFAGQIATAKRTALREYGRLAQRYVTDFEHTWLPGGLPSGTSPLGTGDIQSLADLGNSLETVRSTRPVPITRQMVIGLGVATLAPVAPLLLTVIPAEELAKQLLKLLI